MRADPRVRDIASFTSVPSTTGTAGPTNDNLAMHLGQNHDATRIVDDLRASGSAETIDELEKSGRGNLARDPAHAAESAPSPGPSRTAGRWAVIFTSTVVPHPEANPAT